MAAVRLTRLSRPPSALSTAPFLERASATMRPRFTCMAAGFGSENVQLAGEIERKPVASPKAVTHVVADLDGAVAEPAQTSDQRVDLATLMLFLRTNTLRKLKVVTRRRQWSLIIQSLVEKVIMDSRFFTMFGVAGTLLGSVLCFLEGVFLVVKSYLQYFHALYRHSDRGHIMDLLIKALGASLTPIYYMFLIGTAMLTFGTALHVMFVGSQASKGRPIPSSNLFGLFYLKEFPSWAGMKSISQAKSKIGHALMLLLQVGVLEKFKSIPLVTGLDLACFAAAVFVSSAGLFILSRISQGTN
ncbi:hypothetical protein L1987_44649 [Smallanthus sonchifolius]|uniref:Uncharacterized protein n=1 Tax=Smallanthus sonchifolius TaxID=185202 RepID=A0ACB9GR19_9ASTR|nr:hypothetical protein L1987_44649 [Smallanthus sonchifolius]